MDENAKDIIASDVADNLDERTTYRQALKDVLEGNRSLQKSETWKRPTQAQKKAIRDRITSDKRTKKLSIKKKDDVEYIQVNRNNYRRVLSSKDYYYDADSDTAYMRDSNGHWKEKIHY